MEAFTTALQSERKWRNVQIVLVETFGLVARVLTEQTQLIQELQQRVKDLATVRSDAVSAMEERVRVEMKRLGEEVEAPSIDEEFGMNLCCVEQVQKDSETKAQQQHVEVAKRCVQVEQSVEQRCSKIEERLDHLLRQFKDPDNLTKLRQDMFQKVADLECRLMESEARRETAVIPVMKEVTTPEMQEGEVDAIREDLAHVSREVREAEARIEKQLAGFRHELMMTMGKKLCKSEATKLLSRKMDAMDAWKQLAEKADSARLEEVACALMDSIQRSQENTVDEVDRLRQLNESKADALELVQVKHNMHNILSVAESIQHELSALQRVVNEKMTIVDVKELLDSQSTMNGLQMAMRKVESAAVGEFATKNQVDNIDRHVQAITRQLRSEIYQARYIWKDGRPSAKQTIQWSSQVVNTNADIFLWQFGSDEVRLLLPGLYHLQAAFFTNYSPAIQVLVNGEPVIFQRSASDPKEVSFSPSSGQRAVHRLHHSAGSVAGLSIEVFLALPARALVAVSYDIDEKAQGFLNLRKL
ncbi:Hypothetical protein PHPALM_6849 [Phytophthora palmivora]|uniref:Uncharacterized protein n=1 Tax=Phytophthora palmivora TaxID=4796 RepID=A0A2P4YDU2_9STRA|nr:Hypothetical protein PHPALM_6849 [Phytophthora palmivora]